MADSDSRQLERADRAPWNAREIERRHREQLGKPMGPVLKTAATARELARGA